MIKKLLIANRGEIAARIQKTAQQLGIKTVVVVSDVDKRLPYVDAADEVYLLGGDKPAESYLNQDKIFAALKETGADALHPGFGFLSENAEFVDKLTKKGITFVGPHSKAILAMGDKIESKRLAEKAKVSTVPGFVGELEDDATAKQEAKRIGYPIILKAAAGGGG